MLKTLGLIFLTLPLSAAPNLSGDWKMNASKSDYGPMPAPTSMSMKVTHEDPKLRIDSKQSGEQGEFEMTANYTTDGKECENKFMDTPIKSLVKWEGETLVISSKGSFGGNEVTIVDKWTLSADGKVLTRNQHLASSMGELDLKVVMEKQ